MDDVNRALVDAPEGAPIAAEAETVTGGQPIRPPAGAGLDGPVGIAGGRDGANDLTTPSPVAVPELEPATFATEGEATRERRSEEDRAPRRSIKVVVTLTPAGEADPTWSAVLAVGAAGCDPHLRTVTAAARSEVLAAATALVSEAEQVWTTTPRYPPVPLPAAPTRTTAAAPRRAASAVAGGEPPADPPTTVDDQTDAPVAPTTADAAPTPSVSPPASRGNQLPLFR